MNSQPNRTEHATEPTDRATETERRGVIGSISATADQGRRSTDGEHQRRAAVILGGMYQFVALLNPQGDILEVNRAALEGAGHRIEEIRGKPFWTARWWQVSEKIREELKAAIRRAAAGEFVRYEVQIYGEKAGLIPITIDFSLQPIGSESREVEYLLAEGRNITERKLAEEEVARQSQELRALNERLRNEAELERQELRAIEERLAESNCVYRELQNREAKVRRLVDANIVGVLIWDLDGRILEANDAFLRMVGYQREDLLSGRLRWKDLTPPEWLERDERLWVPQLKITGSLQPFEKEFFRKDHSRVPVLIGGALFEAGGSEGVAFVLDLTERKQAEEGLRRTEKELRDLVENMPAMAGVLLPDGSHPYLTNQWQEYTGLSVAKTDLEGWRRVVHPEDTDLYAQKFRAAAAARKPFDNELRLRRAADGKYRWFLVRISPLCDERGNIVKWHGVMTDIQDRKRAEEATRRSEKELRDVLEQVPGMVFAVVEDGRYGRYSYVSTQWYDYTGLSEAETINGGWQNAIHSEDIEQHMKKYNIAVAEGHPFESEVRLRRAADGQYRWFLIRVTPLRDEAGNVVKWYGFISDIEDRKRAEQERERLRKLEAELAHMNRVSIMGELTASIAHEVNQPLTVVVSNANACARMLSTASPDLDEVRLAVGDIADYGRRASEVLARIRGQLKKSTSAKSSLNIGDVIVEVLPLLRGELEKRRTKLDTDLQSDLPLVSGDRIELQQVLINLLMNGIESMTSIMDRPRVLTVQSRVVESGEVEVAVRDCGVGISVNQMKSLFDPFFTTKPGGMGMGLAISRSIIEAHGGKLWASSNANCGATFQFTLPAA